ncbi:MAG: serine hydrolase domain-containing protein [Nocardioidaceae bacterium]
MSDLRHETTRRLHRTVLDRQRSGRLPGVVAGVVRGGGLLWHEGLGSADLTEPGAVPDADHQFLVASNTKTFTAVLVMALRDEGRLSLDDTLDTFIPEVTQPGLTIRSCLAHVSGMQREPLGDVWETLVNPDTAELVSGFNEAERVHRPHQRWHYSNLVFSMLGEVVARLDARSWAESLQSRVLDPLEMRRTTVGFSGRHAQGYFVPPWTDVPVRQDQLDLKALDPCGGLASTAEDLARWSAFVADPVDEVLAPDTLEEMCEPQVVMDRERWTAAMGLGFFLIRSGTRTYVGHTGGMPGHITALFTDRAAKTGGLALTSSGSTPDIAGFAIALADLVTEHEAVEPEPWRPGASVPPELADLVGVWYSEGSPFAFTVREGRLEARADGLPEHKPSSRFEQVSPDLFRTVAGREHGELLRVTRDAGGRVTKMNWATYLVTREPLAFGEWL